MARPCYRFGEFVLSPARRTLLHRGREVPLIPRYFDLLLLLVERRGEAVHRRQIFDAVWSDVVVSDGALSQAVRTLRRTLGDDVREPVFIRTVARHGYRFVYAQVVEEEGDPTASGAGPVPGPSPLAAGPLPAPATAPAIDREAALEPALRRLLALVAPGTASSGSAEEASLEDERREAAEALHALGTAEALAALDSRPGHEAARALLRDTRWDAPGAGPVPLLGRPGGMRAARILIGLRLRRAARLASSRWAAAAGGGAAAGAVAGALGGCVLAVAPGSSAPSTLPVALAVIGAAIGGLGAAGVGAGLATAEALARSMRGLALVACGALGGGTIGAVAHLLGRLTLEDLFGHDLSAVGGGLEGLLIGAAAGLGYALSTPRPGGGMASPRGWARLASAAVTGACCGAAGLLLSWSGRNLGGGSLDVMARSFQGSQVGLEPLARLLGEAEAGPLTRSALSAYEGFLFGFGLALGLTRRPR